jgi:hypothetical protein
MRFKQMQYVKVKDLSIAFSRKGNGIALILLHGGLNHNSQAWKPQIKSLQKYFTVTAWDAPGALFYASDYYISSFVIYIVNVDTMLNETSVLS